MLGIDLEEDAPIQQLVEGVTLKGGDQMAGLGWSSSLVAECFPSVLGFLLL